MKNFIIPVIAAVVLAGCTVSPESTDYSSLNDYGLVYPYERVSLPFGDTDLAPVLDAETVDIHYRKHHKGYTDRLNAAVAGTDMETVPLLALFAKISTHPASVRNNGGGYYNHNLYWENLSAGGRKNPEGPLAEAIRRDFDSFETFKTIFEQASAGHFASGWAWLSVDSDGKLFVSTTPNQDNPLMDTAAEPGIPILTIDVWEHAYYLDYQNRRKAYIENYWKILDWNKIEARYADAMKTAG